MKQYKFRDEVDKSIRISWAINCAVAIMQKSTIGEFIPSTIGVTKKYADAFMDLFEEMREEINQANKGVDTTKAKDVGKDDAEREMI